ncbi:ComEA family DNA-binding protein [Candidatus Electronema sp. TJ]|uniref:ComEA family DNA-binding protein n=1 Tax=Candidatus Electronema sp. TJ TaxID=3401573 RepID=UPI003AA80BDD
MSSRVLILLLLAVMIFAAGWHAPALEAQVSSYFWVKGKLIRSKGSRAGEGIRLAAGMPCIDTPPELAAFFNLPLPVNRADQAALMRLPGIGPKLSESIILYREGQGSMAGPDDFIKVKGIGPKRSARLLPLLCFD